jgi:hypothetical protein
MLLVGSSLCQWPICSTRKMPTTRALISTCARSLKKSRHHTIFANVVLKSVDKLLLSLHTIDNYKQNFGAHKDLGEVSPPSMAGVLE